MCILLIQAFLTLVATVHYNPVVSDKLRRKTEKTKQTENKKTLKYMFVVPQIIFRRQVKAV